MSEFIDGFAWEKRDKRLLYGPPCIFAWDISFLPEWLGPKYMENRPAVSSTVVCIYNGVMIIADFTLFAKLLQYSWELGYSWGK